MPFPPSPQSTRRLMKKQKNKKKGVRHLRVLEYGPAGGGQRRGGSSVGKHKPRRISSLPLAPDLRHSTTPQTPESFVRSGAPHPLDPSLLFLFSGHLTAKRCAVVDQQLDFVWEKCGGEKKVKKEATKTKNKTKNNRGQKRSGDPTIHRADLNPGRFPAPTISLCPVLLLLISSPPRRTTDNNNNNNNSERRRRRS